MMPSLYFSSGRPTVPTQPNAPPRPASAGASVGSPLGQDAVQFSGLWDMTPERFLKKFDRYIPKVWMKHIQDGTIPVDLRDENGRTLLLRTMKAGNNTGDGAAALLKAGADVDAVDNRGANALMHAAEREYAGPELLKQILEHQPDLSLRDDEGRNPLFYVLNNTSWHHADSWIREADVRHRLNQVAYHEAIEKIDILLEAGYRIDEPDAQGRTLLMRAVQEGQDWLIIPLCARGANPQATDNAGESVMDYARSFADYDRSVAMQERLAYQIERSERRNPKPEKGPGNQNPFL